jgi:hypothetical protein
MIDVLLYTIYVLMAVLAVLVVWSVVHQYTTHND